MEKKHKTVQVYAIIICIIAVITIIICATSLIGSLIDRNDPLYARQYDVNLTSFENFKMHSLKSTQKDQAYIPDDEMLLKMYESAKEDKINLVLHQTHREIIVSSMIILICLVLFGLHWWLMRKMIKAKTEN